MLYLGADHNGYFLKERLKSHLQRRDWDFIDMGAKQYRKADDYVDFATALPRPIRGRDFGILICGSGHGMVIAANKLPGIRAIMPPNPRSARAGRHDDHANVLVLAAWQMTAEDSSKIIDAFLKARPGKARRYLRRLKKIKELEK